MSCYPLQQEKWGNLTEGDTGPIYGWRRRKNCALLVAGSVTDLCVPSSLMLAALVTQLAGTASVPPHSDPVGVAEGRVNAHGMHRVGVIQENGEHCSGRHPSLP